MRGRVLSGVLVLLLILPNPRASAQPTPRLQIKSFSVGPDQTVIYPDSSSGTNQLAGFADEHPTFFPPAASGAPYLVFGAASTSVSSGIWGAAVLQTTDLKTFTFATSLGYNSPVLTSPVSYTQCNPTYDATWDENYAAPGSVLQDPTLPAGNLIMLIDAEQHCPGGVWQRPFYISVGFARSSDNGKTWPAPEIGALGGPSRHPILQSPEPQPTVPHKDLGNGIPTGFVDKSASGDYYLYVAYTDFPSSGTRVARAKLGADPLTFLKWYNGSFSQPGIGGLDSAILPSTGCANDYPENPEISYNDDLGLYLMILKCLPASPVGGWYYSTATSLDLEDWTAPQSIQNSQYPWTPCTTAGEDFDGSYPSTISPGAASGHTKLTGYIFFTHITCDLATHQFMSRTFTIVAEPTLPSPTSALPAAGSGTAGTFTFTFSDTGGFASLTVLDVLINSALDGRKACYVAFVPSGPSSGSVYLVDDTGDAGGPYSGMTLPGTQSVSNGQCTITGAGSSVSSVAQAFLPVSPGSLTLTLAIAFSPAFAGNQVIYMSAQDASSNSGWQALGTWNVPGSAPAGPWVGGMSPGHSTHPTETYKFTFSDTNGWQDITVADILVNSAIDGQQACYVAFVPTGAASGLVYLVDDAGDAGGPYAGMVLPGSGSVSNGQCSVGGAASSVGGSGNTLTLTLTITFSPTFAGNQVFFLAARNNNGQNSNWQAVGTVTVP